MSSGVGGRGEMGALLAQDEMVGESGYAHGEEEEEEEEEREEERVSK